MTRPSMDETLMTIAMTMAMRGTCSRNKVGAVASLNGRILATGYNGAPAGMPHCQHIEGAGLHDPLDLARCVAVHAEANLIAFAAKLGIALNGSTMYTTLTPCVTCAGLLINSGIRRVYSARSYRDPAGVELLRDATIDVIDWSGRELAGREAASDRLDGGSGCATELARRAATGTGRGHRDIGIEAAPRQDPSRPDW